jgi:hypothetical protein
MESCETKKEMIYKFVFRTTNERLCLTQEQLNHIPYLSTLLQRQDDFLSIRNKNGEYMLSPPLYSKWFMPIFRSINSQQPYLLFDELSEDENVLDVLQLFDYLGIDGFDSPLLKEEKLILSNSVDDHHIEQNRRVEYHRASLSEARNTAAQFIMSISKNEYDLKDPDTAESIFNLIMVILSNESVFSYRFRSHTLTIVKEYCQSIFSKGQRHQLPTHQDLLQNSSIDPLMYLYDNEQSLPENFQNAFAWKGAYTLTQTNDDTMVNSHFNIIIFGKAGVGKSTLINYFRNYSYMNYYERNMNECSIRSPWNIDSNDILFDCVDHQVSSIDRKKPVKKQYLSESESARSGRLNTLPKQRNIDTHKFKHRSGPKTQKHR